jgi:hypothetical protein
VSFILTLASKWGCDNLEFVKLAQIMATKGNNLLHNIKIRWISMLNPMQHVLEEYHLLLLKMVIDLAILLGSKYFKLIV